MLVSYFYNTKKGIYIMADKEKDWYADNPFLQPSPPQTKKD